MLEKNEMCMVWAHMWGPLYGVDQRVHHFCALQDPLFLPGALTSVDDDDHFCVRHFLVS